METTTGTSQFKGSYVNEQTKTKSESKSILQSKLWEQAESARFAVSPLILLVMSIMAGIAAAFGIVDSTFQLILVVFPSAITLALILSLAPMKAIIYCSAVAVLIDILVILF